MTVKYCWKNIKSSIHLLIQYITNTVVKRLKRDSVSILDSIAREDLSEDVMFEQRMTGEGK